MRHALASILVSFSLSAAAETAPAPAPSGDAAPSPSAVAQLRRRVRLERQVAALEHELAGFPADLDATAAARDRARIIDGLEVWDITAERSDLRARIDRLRERITLLEQIQQHQDDLDRARLVEHQRVLAEVGSERAVARLNQDEIVIEVHSAQRLLAARQAKAEMLARLRGQLNAIVAQGEPIAVPATIINAPAKPGVEITITPAHVDPVAATPAPTTTPAPTATTPAEDPRQGAWGIFSDAKPQPAPAPVPPDATPAPAPVQAVPEQP